MKANCLFGIGDADGIHYSSKLSLDLGEVEPSVAGPKRPMDLVPLSGLKGDFVGCLTQPYGHKGYGLSDEQAKESFKLPTGDGAGLTISHGSLAVAAITSCTNTSNPSVLLAAGLVAKNAIAAGLQVPPFVKTSLAPGSRVVTEYLEAAGLQTFLDQLGFQTVGYGCTTCMGNSGEVDPGMQEASEKGVVTGAILSGNRNFESRVHPSVGAAYLASPPLVVAGALAGTLDIDFDTEALGHGKDGKAVFLKDIWPSPEEIDAHIAKFVRPDMFQNVYTAVATGKAGSDSWKNLKAPESATFDWDSSSTYIMKPPFLQGFEKGPEAQGLELCSDAYCLLLLGDSVTTDHISPVFKIKADTPAGRYLKDRGVEVKDLTSFGARRGSAEVMTRGTIPALPTT
jgi:aconitate hydratase